MSNLHKASSQWATRPADQRFWTIEDLLRATQAHHDAARTATVNNVDLRVEAIDSSIQLVGRTGAPAQLTNWAFKQISHRAEAPAGYLATLPATLAAQNLNHGLKQHCDSGTTRMLLHENGGYYARALTSEKYTRIWNVDIAKRLAMLQDYGWRVPPARPAGDAAISDLAIALATGVVRHATVDDARLSLTVRPGDLIGPSGLYASFEDMFVFMVNPERKLDDGSSEGLMRGFFAWNSEVGKSSFGVMTFLFRGVCGNHIVWGAKGIAEIRVRHIGNADDKAFEQLAVELVKYSDKAAGADELTIQKAKTHVLATTSEKLLDYIFDRGILRRNEAEDALAAVQPEVDGDPLTVWGYAQGITRMSQREVNADRRVALDRAAGKVLEVVFLRRKCPAGGWIPPAGRPEAGLRPP